SDGQCLAGHAKRWRFLLALISIGIDEPYHAPNVFLTKARVDDFLCGLPAYEIAVDDFIENIIRRKRILVRLVGAKLRARRFGERALGNGIESSSRVESSADGVNHLLGHVGDGCKSAGSVAVER